MHGDLNSVSSPNDHFFMTNQDSLMLVNYTNIDGFSMYRQAFAMLAALVQGPFSFSVMQFELSNLETSIQDRMAKVTGMPGRRFKRREKKHSGSMRIVLIRHSPTTHQPYSSTFDMRGHACGSWTNILSILLVPPDCFHREESFRRTLQCERIDRPIISPAAIANHTLVDMSLIILTSRDRLGHRKLASFDQLRCRSRGVRCEVKQALFILIDRLVSVHLPTIPSAHMFRASRP